MKITLEEEDKVKAKRLLAADDAFGLLWDIDQLLRGYLKYGPCGKSTDEIMEEVRDLIHEDNLLDLYN